MTRDTTPRTATSRRSVLAVGGAALTTALAGCTGGGNAGRTSTSESTSNEGDGPNDDGEAGETTAKNLLGGHPAAAGFAAQPRLGPPPGEATGVVVAFEDPSCPRCAAFERNTVPKIRRNLGDRVSFVLRTYPVVYPWGKPATQAVEAAFARETEMGETETTADGESATTTGMAPPGSRQGSVATWALIDHYFSNQSAFDEDNVFEKTGAFLASETDLDADAVVADAESKAYDDAVQADLSAGERAGVSSTPTVFLFRDGEFRTSAKGSVSYSAVKSALGL